MDSSKESVAITINSSRRIQYNVGDELPVGSPSFANVMNDLASALPAQSSLTPEKKTEATTTINRDDPKTETMSPTQLRSKERCSVNGRPSRTSSWNARNKKAADKRKELHRLQMEKWAGNVGGSQPNSASSSPSFHRKFGGKARSPATTPNMTRQPRFRFVSESVSVLHEELVNEKLKNLKNSSDDEIDRNSIFHTPKIYRRFPDPKKTSRLISDSEDSD